MTATWQSWAMLSAAFAALTAIFAKVGVENVNADLATLIRTIVIVAVLAAIVWAFGEYQPPSTIADRQCSTSASTSSLVALSCSPAWGSANVRAVLASS